MEKRVYVPNWFSVDLKTGVSFSTLQGTVKGETFNIQHSSPDAHDTFRGAGRLLRVGVRSRGRLLLRP